MTAPRRGDPYVMCRSVGHAWFEVPDDADWSTRRVWRWRMVLRCERCGMVRYDGIDAYGQVGHRHYAPPPGYSYPKDATPSRSDFRLRMLRRDDRARTRRPALRVVTDGIA